MTNKTWGIVITLGLAFAIAFVSAGWAIDGRIDEKITRQIEPIREDIRAIRTLLERILMP